MDHHSHELPTHHASYKHGISRKWGHKIQSSGHFQKHHILRKINQPNANLYTPPDQNNNVYYHRLQPKNLQRISKMRLGQRPCLIASYQDQIECLETQNLSNLKQIIFTWNHRASRQLQSRDPQKWSYRSQSGRKGKSPKMHWCLLKPAKQQHNQNKAISQRNSPLIHNGCNCIPECNKR